MMRYLCKVIVSLFILTVLAGCTTSQVTHPRDRSITVSGEAEVKAVPDTVNLILGIQTRDTKLGIAKSQADEILGKVLSFLRSQGVDPQDIQTAYLDLEPDYASYERRAILGYFVRETLGVTLRDVSKFDGLLSGALEAGVSQVYGIDFRTSELKTYRTQARALALQAAREKAEAMARELGQEIGDPLSIREDPLPMWGLPRVSQNSVNASQSLETLGETMALGQISIRAQVTVEFSLE